MKVSVLIITYNHESFIAKALDSVLMQTTNFQYEIVVGEDCSTDRTRDILIDYQKRYPQKLRLLLNNENLGTHKNGRQTLEACTGEYIAFLEGDDFWISSEKLQRQVDYLDNHPECAFCYHNALIVHEDGSKEPTHYRSSQKEFSTVDDLLLDNFIPTCSVMYRRGLFGRLPDWLDALKMGDWPMHILNALHGKVGYIDETMAVYVVHPGGIWSTKDWQENDKAIIELFEALNRHLPTKYTRSVRRILRYRYILLSENYENVGDLAAARAYTIKSIAKHFLIISEPFRYANRCGSKSVNSLPNYFKSIRSSKLFKNLVRLYVVPILEMYTPRLYNFLKTIARRFNLNLY